MFTSSVQIVQDVIISMYKLFVSNSSLNYTQNCRQMLGIRSAKTKIKLVALVKSY